MMILHIKKNLHLSFSLSSADFFFWLIRCVLWPSTDTIFKTTLRGLDGHWLCVAHAIAKVIAFPLYRSLSLFSPLSISLSQFCSPLTLKITENTQIPACTNCEYFCLLLPKCEVNPLPASDKISP